MTETVGPIDPVPFFHNLGIVVLCIAGWYWKRVAFEQDSNSKESLKQAAFFTSGGFYLLGLSLLFQAL